MISSSSEGSSPAQASARCDATVAISIAETCETRRSFMPVRVVIHSSDVSRKVDRSALDRTAGGIPSPHPVMAAYFIGMIRVRGRRMEVRPRAPDCHGGWESSSRRLARDRGSQSEREPGGDCQQYQEDECEPEGNDSARARDGLPRNGHGRHAGRPGEALPQDSTECDRHDPDDHDLPDHLLLRDGGRQESSAKGGGAERRKYPEPEAPKCE